MVSAKNNIYSLKFHDFFIHPILLPVAADLSLCGLKPGWKK